ncbi:MAG TPA: oxidoreductase [Vicinamibacterales bacterium]|jgi:NAD(P)-dependent dehydrogenase (short-subunit alcohol dehydrogenase family)|nr:oxidoreductase [Vicinamibacterales bacterium]
MADGESAVSAVLITGCSSGIGRATALRLARRPGSVVYATARRPADIADLEQVGCRTLALDVTDEASMASAVQTIEAAHGAVDVLVNNAGYSQSGAVEAVPLDRVRAQFETNVFGPLRLTQLVLPAMRRRRRGTVVNLSSMGGKLVFPGGGVYHATKYAIEALSDALRFEVAGFGIRVVIVEPGLIRTAFSDAALGAMRGADDAVYGEFHAAVGRTTANAYSQGLSRKLSGTPDDVARVIERAIAARRPKTRYRVAPSATLFLNLRRVLGDRGWDRFLRGVYPSPGANRTD